MYLNPTNRYAAICHVLQIIEHPRLVHHSWAIRLDSTCVVCREDVQARVAISLCKYVTSRSERMQLLKSLLRYVKPEDPIIPPRHTTLKPGTSD